MYKKFTLLLMTITTLHLDASSLPNNLLLGAAAISAMTISKAMESERKAHAFEELLQDRGELRKLNFFKESKPDEIYLLNIIAVSVTAQVAFAGLNISIQNNIQGSCDVIIVSGTGTVLLGCGCALAYNYNVMVDDAIKKTEEISESELDYFDELV